MAELVNALKYISFIYNLVWKDRSIKDYRNLVTISYCEFESHSVPPNIVEMIHKSFLLRRMAELVEAILFIRTSFEKTEEFKVIDSVKVVDCKKSCGFESHSVDWCG